MTNRSCCKLVYCLVGGPFILKYKQCLELCIACTQGVAIHLLNYLLQCFITCVHTHHTGTRYVYWFATAPGRLVLGNQDGYSLTQDKHCQEQQCQDNAGILPHTLHQSHASTSHTPPLSTRLHQLHTSTKYTPPLLTHASTTHTRLHCSHMSFTTHTHTHTHTLHTHSLMRL